MRRYLFSLLLGLLVLNHTHALDAGVTAATYDSADSPFLELYFYILGSSVTAVPTDEGTVQAAVTGTVMIKRAGDIVKAERFQLNAPADSTIANFLDLRRYALPNGTYQVEIELTDANDPENSRILKETLTVGYHGDQIQLSDLHLLADARPESDDANPFVRNGVYLEPLPFRFYHKNLDRLHLYVEAYRTDAHLTDEAFVFHYTVRDATLDAGSEPLLERYKRATAAAVVPQVVSMDLSELPSGNYELTVEVMNRQKEVLAERTTFFQRSNPSYIPETFAETGDVDLGQTFAGKLTADELRYALKAIKPLALPRDGELLNTIIDGADPRAQRNYLYAHFARQNADDPDAAYRRYMEVAQAVDRMFGNGFGYGFETDRGNIFLRYGRPSDMVTVENDPYAPPYEIWVYYDYPATRQSNVKFMFYNPTLATNGHVLLHSTARNELNNPRWEVILYEDAPEQIEGNNPLEGTTMQSGYLRNAREFWEDF